MADSWHFFTELRATTAGHCETVWRWRRSGGSVAAESGPFAVLPDCVADARKEGYDDETLHITLSQM